LLRRQSTCGRKGWAFGQQGDPNGKSHSTIIRWEQRLAAQASQWSVAAPEGGDVTVEGDEVYTRVDENLPPF
jgi:hypothetical protein